MFDTSNLSEPLPLENEKSYCKKAESMKEKGNGSKSVETERPGNRSNIRPRGCLCKGERVDVKIIRFFSCVVLLYLHGSTGPSLICP